MAAKKTTVKKAAAKKAAPRKAAAKAAVSSHGFKVGDVVRQSTVDAREARQFTIVETSGDQLIGELGGQRYVMDADKVVKAEG